MKRGARVLKFGIDIGLEHVKLGVHCYLGPFGSGNR
jgi:hypothetical protein